MGSKVEPMVDVIIKGSKVGEISLATEYKILLQGMILGAKADIEFVEKRLAELDKLIANSK